MNLWSYKYRECFLLQADGEPEGRQGGGTRVLVTLCLLIPVHVFSDQGKIPSTGSLRFLHFPEHRLYFQNKRMCFTLCIQNRVMTTPDFRVFWTLAITAEENSHSSCGEEQACSAGGEA